MAATLLLRLAGPMQSWGTRSRFSIRDTEREPSKSGVIGLLCAALGQPRQEPVDDLAALRLAVRVDLEGTLRTDYHTAGGAYPEGIVQADGKRSRNAVLSNRDYLADSDFLVALEAPDRATLEPIAEAVRSPRWQVCLGRKAFTPSVPLWLPPGDLPAGAIVEGGAIAALATIPWPRAGLAVESALRSELGRRPQGEPAQAAAELRERRIVIEYRDGDEGDPERRADFDLIGADHTMRDVRADQPAGAAFEARSFTMRRVLTGHLRLGDESGSISIRKEN